MSLTLPKPSFAQGFARHASESAFPELWNGLVGCWAPEFGRQGDRLYDFSPTKRDAVFQSGVPEFIPSEGGWSAKFNDSSDVHIAKSQHHPAHNVSHITLSAWVKKHNTNSTYGGIVGRQFSTSSGDAYLLAENNNANNDYAVVIRTTGGADQILTSLSSVADLNKWVHIAATFDGATMRIYRNGIQIASKAHAFPGLINTSSANSIAIGAGYTGSGIDAGPSEYLRSSLRLVMVHGRALLPSEIQQLYSGASPLTLKRRTVAKAPAGGLTAVGNSRDLSFDIYAGVGNTRAISYDIYGAVGNSRSLSYDLYSTIGNSRALSFDIYAGVGNSRAISYDIYGTAGNSRALSFDIYGTAGNTRDLTYDIESALTSVGNTRSLSYDIYGTVGGSRVVSFDIYAPAMQTEERLLTWRFKMEDCLGLNFAVGGLNLRFDSGPLMKANQR